MAVLTDLPNLGDVVAGQLKRAGVETPSQLRRLGSVGAALRLNAIGVDVCSSKLSALEGAIRGVRWHSIPRDERAELMRRFEARRRG
jgi:DNA transformation protein